VSLLRSNLVVATGTALSRVTGLLRVSVFGIVIGQTALADAYTIGNETPNIVYELLIGGVLSSSLLAAGLAWWRLAPLTAVWRRGVFSMIAALGTIVGALAATPIHFRFGQAGLLVLAGCSAIMAVVALWSARPGPPGE